MAANIHFSTSFQSYIYGRRQECKIAEILQYEQGNEDLITDKYLNHITFRNDGNISYLPAGKEHKVNPDTGEWLREGRQDGKAAKVIRKLFTKEALEKLSDSDFEKFSNSYKSSFSEEGFTLELLDRSQIKRIYDMKIGEGEGCLAGSCMNGDSNYMDIYSNCKDLQILALTKDGRLYGRALVWKVKDDIVLMDRIYTTKDFLFEKFLDFAKSNNFWRKKHYKSYDYKTDFIKPDGTEVYKEFTIKTPTDFDYYPYIDTFSYGGDGFLSNDSGDCIYTYDSTGGERQGGDDDHEGESWDDLRGEHIDEDYATTISHGSSRYRHMTTHIDDTITTEDGNVYHCNDEDVHFVKINRRYYDHDSDEIRMVDGEYYHEDDVVYCERDSEDYLQADCVEDVNGDWILRSEAVMVNGDWIHEDDVENFKDVEMLGANQEVCTNPNQTKLFTE